MDSGFFVQCQDEWEQNMVPVFIQQTQHKLADKEGCKDLITVNQQILAAIKFGVSQNKVIWQLLNLGSPHLCSVQSKSFTYVGGDKY